jgi:16S rRNA (guanine(966)-N(2))-methyltransferase RsmD
MRVIAGTARGRPLVAPRGAHTRPITDRVKETLFGILGDRVIDARVLDLYAGSGSVGIEALSRGAASCAFVENDRRAVAAIRENLQRAGVAEDASVHGMDVMRYLEHPDDDRFRTTSVLSSRRSSG